MAGLMNTVSRLAGTAGSVSRRRGTRTPTAGGGMGRRRSGMGAGMGSPATRGSAAGAAGGLLSRFLKRR
jgi:hypothetical protein